MATRQISEVIQHFRRTVLLADGAGLTDGQLLEDYISRRDEASLAALVRRHGPMVWGVCRRVLCNYHDAEDAFQATFLVLVRKGASIASRELLANWLYGVAHQTALKARATTAKRRTRERQVTAMPEPAVAEQDLWRDLQPLLDEELIRLPDKYRAVIVLCDLEGKTRKEAARQLGVPEGTVAGRLARARTMLAKRLTQRGVALSGGVLAAVLSHKAASAGVPTSVAYSTIKAAGLLAAGQAAATALISAKVAALTEGVLKAMLMSNLKVVMMVLVIAVIAVVGIGGHWLAHSPAAETRRESPTAKAEHQEADAPKRQRDKQEVKKLRGIWEVVAYVDGGEKKSESDGGVFVFKDNTIRSNFYGDFTLDTSKKPRQMKFTIRNKTKGREEEYDCIYELRGDDLKIAFCNFTEEKDPPKEFKSTSSNGVTVIILKRLKLERDEGK
jgi:RNA polymerase sigma factor (sigma-70 family)